MEHHIIQSALPWKELGGGMRRKVIAHTPAIMSVLVQFEKGAVGAVHLHEVHTQSTFVVSGSFEIEVAGVKRVLRAGDSFMAPPGTPHGVVCLEDKGELLDVFSPRRDDFL